MILSNLTTWSADFALEANTARVGADYLFSWAPDWRSCPLECRHRPECQAFSLAFDSTAGAYQCWLKNAVQTPAFFQGWYAGRK
jgi:hypothetical protein